MTTITVTNTRQVLNASVIHSLIGVKLDIQSTALSYSIQAYINLMSKTSLTTHFYYNTFYIHF